MEKAIKVMYGTRAINADLKRQKKRHEIRAMLAETEREREEERQKAASIYRTLLFLESLDKDEDRTHREGGYFIR